MFDAPLRRYLPYAEDRLIATSTTLQYRWYTPWQLAVGVTTIRPVLKSKNSSGSSFSWQYVIQTATVRTDDPGGPQTLAAAQTGDGEYCPGDVTVSSYTGSAMWFRLGVAYKYSGVSPTVVEADVGHQASWNQLGTILGSRSVQLDANDGGSRIAPLTGWFPAIYAGYIRAAIIANGVSGGSYLQYKIMSQTAATSIQQPGSWTSIDTGWHALTTNTETTPELTLSTSDMWARIGVAYSLASGTTQTNAMFNALVTCRS
jgi:hypothetical protein